MALADLSRYVMVLATKRRDDLVTGLRAAGWTIVSRYQDILWAENEPVTPKVVVWPQPSEKASSRERAAFLQRELREVMNSAQRSGHWTIIADETMYLSEQLGLERELNEIWYGGRSLHISLVSLMQRPARVPRLAFSQASYLFLGKFPDRRDIETLREVATVIPKQVMEEGIKSLSKPKHEFLFVDCVNDTVAITVAPPRG